MCRHQKLFSIVCTPIRYVTLHFRNCVSKSKRSARNDSVLDLANEDWLQVSVPLLSEARRVLTPSPKTQYLSRMQRHSGARSPPTLMPTLVILPNYVNTLNIFFSLYISIHVFLSEFVYIPLNFPLSLSVLFIACFIVIFMYFVVSGTVV